MSNAFIQKLQQRSKASSIDFVAMDSINCEIIFKDKLSVMNILNSKVEEFITCMYFNKRFFIVGFIGRTCIIKETPIEVANNEGDKSFCFSIKRDLLKILDGKDELKFILREGTITWNFKFGDGYIIKRSKPTSSIYEVKKYLDFILNHSLGNKEGSFNSDEVKAIHKKLMKIESDPMMRNVILGENYIFSILTSYAFYIPSNTKSSTLLTESIITNLPRANEEFDIIALKEFTGLIGKNSGVSYIFPTRTTKDLIKPYTSLIIDWFVEIEGIHNAIKVITFGDRNVEIELIANSNNQTIQIGEFGNQDNKFIGVAGVLKDSIIRISSVIQDFNDITRIGSITNKGREHLKAILFKGGEICLLR